MKRYKSKFSKDNFDLIDNGSTAFSMGCDGTEKPSRLLLSRIQSNNSYMLGWEKAVLTTSCGQTLKFLDLESIDGKLAFLSEYMRLSFKFVRNEIPSSVSEKDLQKYKGWVVYKTIQQSSWMLKIGGIPAYDLPNELVHLGQDLQTYHKHRRLIKDNGITSYKTLDAFANYIKKLKKELDMQNNKNVDDPIPAILKDPNERIFLKQKAVPPNDAPERTPTTTKQRVFPQLHQ